MPAASDIAKLCDLPTAKVDEIFDVILRLVAKGERVTIRGFGAFERKVHKGRTQITPIVKDGSVTYPDRFLLKFRPGATAKERFNRKATSTVTKKPRKK
jgi:integration host factor subunit beta